MRTKWSIDRMKELTRKVVSLITTDLEEKMLAKEARCDFKADVRKFLSNLVNFSIYLKKRPIESRKEDARKFLNNMNGWLYRRKLNQKKIKSEYHHYLYEGILFPFSPQGNTASTLVLPVNLRS